MMVSVSLYSFVCSMIRLPPRSTRTATLFPYTTRFLSLTRNIDVLGLGDLVEHPTIRRKGLREISHHIVNMNEGQRKVLIHGNRLPSLSLFAFPLTLSLVSANNPPGHVTINPTDSRRSEERRVGKGCVGKCRTRWSPSH